jgi:hypothetical protein
MEDASSARVPSGDALTGIATQVARISPDIRVDWMTPRLSETIEKFMSSAALSHDIASQWMSPQLSETVTKFMTSAAQSPDLARVWKTPQLSETITKFMTSTALSPDLVSKWMSPQLSEAVTKFMTSAAASPDLAGKWMSPQLSETITKFMTSTALSPDLVSKWMSPQLSETITKFVTSAAYPSALAHAAGSADVLTRVGEVLGATTDGDDLIEGAGGALAPSKQPGRELEPFGPSGLSLPDRVLGVTIALTVLLTLEAWMFVESPELFAFVNGTVGGLQVAIHRLMRWV